MSHAVNVLGFKRIEGFLRPKQNCATFLFRNQVHPFLIWHWLSQNFELLGSFNCDKCFRRNRWMAQTQLRMWECPSNVTAAFKSYHLLFTVSFIWILCLLRKHSLSWQGDRVQPKMMARLMDFSLIDPNDSTHWRLLEKGHRVRR